MSLKEHEVFKVIEEAGRHEKKDGHFGIAQHDKIAFFRALGQAHPIVYDRKISDMAMLQGRTVTGFENVVEDFSLPFKTSLYLIETKMGQRNQSDQGDYKVMVIPVGYLIQEITPELFKLFKISWATYDDIGGAYPAIEQFDLNLGDLKTMMEHLAALKSVVEGESDEAYKRPLSGIFKEAGVVLELSKAISVKRVGVEKARSFSVRSKGVTHNGYTSIKAPNNYHVAFKEEYEYRTSPFSESDIKWSFSGYWRGHWRAFYVKDALGLNERDSKGRNIVDYNRFGKDRTGEYNTAGYTWVKEHVKGDPKLAEMKTHYVVNK